jgi:hypothetical protein
MFHFHFEHALDIWLACDFEECRSNDLDIIIMNLVLVMFAIQYSLHLLLKNTPVGVYACMLMSVCGGGTRVRFMSPSGFETKTHIVSFGCAKATDSNLLYPSYEPDQAASLQ